MNSKKSNKVRLYQTVPDRILTLMVWLLLLLIFLVIIVPILFIVASSFSDPGAVSAGKVFLWPVDFSLAGYRVIFQSSYIMRGFYNSVVYTLLGTVISVTLTLIAGYPLARKELKIRGVVMFLFTVTMFFSGGMIPTYILIKNLGMLDTIWALVIPTSISVWNLIITRTYFQSTIPGEVQESASVDGCDDFTFLIKIAIPLAKPILAVNVLLYAVGHWNSYFNEMMYLSTNTKFPLQLVLREILVNMGTAGMTLDVTKQLEMQETKYLLQYSSIIVGSVPVMLLYPFVQKYFVKGIMVGAIKG